MAEAPAIAVIRGFYAAEDAYMNGGDKSFGPLAATLHEDVVLHQSPDLPWGGQYRGHEGYEAWAGKMSEAFDSLQVSDPQFLLHATSVATSCRFSVRARASRQVIDAPMLQLVRTVGDKIIEFRPFYWNVPAYVAALGMSS